MYHAGEVTHEMLEVLRASSMGWLSQALVSATETARSPGDNGGRSPKPATQPVLSFIGERDGTGSFERNTPDL